MTARARNNNNGLSQQVFRIEFNTREHKKYEVEAIRDDTIYNKAIKSQLLGLDYSIS